MFILWHILGVASLAGLGLSVFMMFFTAFIAQVRKRFLVLKLKKKDERVKLTNEALANMKAIKIYAWEEAVQGRIENVREEEMNCLRKATLLNLAAQVIWTAAPVFITLITFGVYLALDPDNDLDAGKAFVSLVLFGILRLALVMLPNSIAGVVQFIVSFKRVGEFLMLDELDPKAVEKKSAMKYSDFPIRVINGTFQWKKTEKEGDSSQMKIENLNLQIAKGSLVAVVGEIGSGKSSILAALLGEMDKRGGRVILSGSVAHVPQTPWILNKTIKENIMLTAKTRNEAYYEKVIDACALAADFKQMPKGDETEIGDKGANLSGGQRQRIALARAIFTHHDIYLLDDTLSAVDHYTAKHLFDNVIGPQGLLAQGIASTRVWVTHKISFIHECDHIIFMSNGKVLAQGSFDSLVANCPPFTDLVRNHVLRSRSSVAAEQTPEVVGKQKRRGSSLTEKIPVMTSDEQIQEGAVKWQVYSSYIKAMGIVSIIFYLLIVDLQQLLGVFAQFWLADWTEEAEKYVKMNSSSTNSSSDYDKGYNMVVYTGFSLSLAFFLGISAILIGLATLTASRKLHKNLISNIFRSNIGFFERTPSGRMLNRFSIDMEIIDTVIVEFLSKVVPVISSAFVTVLIVSIKIPLTLIVGVPLFILTICIQRIFAASIRQLRRIELALQSPLLSHLNETINGASSIRAYGLEKQFSTKFMKLLDNNHAAYFAGQLTSGWLLVRTELMAACIVFTIGLLGTIYHDWIVGSDVMLALTYSVFLGTVLFWGMINGSLLESNVVAVERVEEYNDTPKDDPWVVSEVDNSPEMKYWPHEGSIFFDNIVFRYRQDMEPVLRNVTLSIRPKEKIAM